MPAPEDDVLQSLEAEFAQLGPGAASDRLEGYELLDELHRGGQGVVYRALQRSTRREVAVKVLLDGAFASPRALRRFEREVELVAGLDHPNIARVYDSGVSAEGRPFLVMQLVDGAHADAALENPDGTLLDLRQKLTLAAKIARAVDFAHEHGVLHRDLKPANVLVDASGEPHVLDFGLAMGVGDLDADQTRLTRTGEFMGTLAYAAPEQVAGRPTEIDVRTDVYALGAMLYELLTGRLPHSIDGSVAELVRAIQVADPRPPAHADGGRDLDTIVLKALSKEKSRRYPSAGALADDIERFLAGRPILARPDTWSYRTKMFVRRNRLLVASTLTVLLSLVVGLVVSLGLYVDAEAARAQESEQRALAELREYAAHLGAANLAIAAGDGGSARQHLEAADEGLRGWEWRHLASRADLSSYVIPVGAPARALAFSPSQPLLAIGGEDRRVRVWDLDSMTEVTVIEGFAGFVTDVAFSADGREVYAVSERRRVTAWNLESGERRVAWPTPPGGANCLALDADGRRVAIGSRGGVIVVRDIGSTDEPLVLEGHTSEVSHVAFHPFANVLVSSGGQVACLWDLESGAELARHDFSNDVESVAFDSSGTRVYAQNRGLGIRWMATDGRALGEENRHPLPSATKISFEAGTGGFVVGDGNGAIRLSSPTADSPERVLLGHAGRLRAFAWDPRGRWLASGSQDGTVRLWDRRVDDEAPLRERKAWFAGIDLAAGGTRMISSGAGAWGKKSAAGSVTYWDLETGEVIWRTEETATLLPGVALHPDGETIAVARADGVVELLDAEDGALLATRLVHAMDVRDVAFSPNGAWLATASLDGTIRLLDPADLSERAVLEGTSIGGLVAFDPRGTTLMSGREDDTVGFWSIPAGETLTALDTGSGGNVYDVEWSADGRLVAATSFDGTTRVWTRVDGVFDPQPRVLPHPGEVFAAVFLDGGARLATGGEDGVVRIWDTNAGLFLVALRGHAERISRLDYDEELGRLVSISIDGEIRVWDAPVRDAGSR